MKKLDLTAICDSYSRSYYQLIEGELVRIIEVLEDRVPTDDEVRALGMKRIFPDGHIEWTWRDRIILVQNSGFPATFKSLRLDG